MYTTTITPTVFVIVIISLTMILKVIIGLMQTLQSIWMLIDMLLSLQHKWFISVYFSFT